MNLQNISFDESKSCINSCLDVSEIDVKKVKWITIPTPVVDTKPIKISSIAKDKTVKPKKSLLGKRKLEKEAEPFSKMQKLSDSARIESTSNSNSNDSLNNSSIINKRILKELQCKPMTKAGSHEPKIYGRKDSDDSLLQAEDKTTMDSSILHRNMMTQAQDPKVMPSMPMPWPPKRGSKA